MLNALVIEDHKEVRDWLVELVCEAFPGTEVKAVPTLEQARELVSDLAFGLALIDIGLPDGSGIDFVREVSVHHPDTYCVMATIYDDDEHIFGALQAGARGYLLKEQPREKLLAQLQGILHGEPPLSPGVARRMMKHFQSEPMLPQDAELSEREIQVLTLAGQGYRRKEIAEAMAISSHTVAGHLKSIYRKLNISTQAEAALKAVRLGLISDWK